MKIHGTGRIRVSLCTLSFVSCTKYTLFSHRLVFRSLKLRARLAISHFQHCRPREYTKIQPGSRTWPEQRCTEEKGRKEGERRDEAEAAEGTWRRARHKTRGIRGFILFHSILHGRQPPREYGIKLLRRLT